MSRSATIFMLFLFSLSGCSGTEPLPAKCVVDPLSINFGSLIPPQSDTETRTLEQMITISNLPLATSDAGNENVDGTLEIHIQAPQANPPEFYLLPVGTDPSFDIPNKESVSVDIAVAVVKGTSTGPYEGTIRLGRLCSEIPFEFYVAAREEDPPVFSLEWGHEGSELGAFLYPTACAVNANGEVYVVDGGNVRIQKFDGNGVRLGGWEEWDELDEDEGLTRFYLPSGIAVDGNGFVYVADQEPEHRDARITKFDGAGNYIKRLGPLHGGGSVLGTVWQVGVGPDEHIFSVDVGNFVIKKFELIETGVGYNQLTSWGGWGTGPGQFRSPYGLAVDHRNGDVYVSDTVNHNIQKFNSDGVFLLRWGSEGSGPGEFREPLGMSVDDQGNVFVVDQRNRRVQKFDQNGAFLSEWGIIGTRPGEFADLIDVSVDGSGNVFIVDSGTHRIHKFVPPGP